MPQTRRAMSADERVQAEISEEIERFATLIAAEWGPAPGASLVPEDDEVELWGQRDPLVDYDALFQTLTTTGVTDPAMLDPENPQGLAIAKTAPEVAQLLAQPVDDPALAASLATLAEFPQRVPILAPYEQDPEGGVKKAQSLDRAWQRRVSKQMEAGPADPMPMMEAQ